jgi:hypothetical protein
MTTATIIICRTNNSPVTSTLPEGLNARQAIVGGTLYCFELAPGIDVWSNDCSILLGLELNQTVIPYGDQEIRFHGDFFIAGCSRSGAMTGLTTAQIDEVMNLLGD